MESLWENRPLLYALLISSSICLLLLMQPELASGLVDTFELVAIPFEVCYYSTVTPLLLFSIRLFLFSGSLIRFIRSLACVPMDS